jgi:RNA recognition motif-containing protein
MKLYVGNLPYAVDDDRLREIFGAVGTPLSATVVLDRASGRSKGYGFVEMSEEDARRAIEALNRSQLDGRTIWVNEARAKV